MIPKFKLPIMPGGPSWQAFMCRLGFHRGKWGEPYTHTTNWIDEITGKISYSTTDGRQRKTCEVCGLEQQRLVKPE